MKKIIKIILIVIVALLIFFFVFRKEKSCILNVETLTGEGYEVIQVNEYTYEISFLGELGRLEQVIKLDVDNNIMSVNELKTEYNKPFFFEDFEIKSETSNFYSIEQLAQVENINTLRAIFESGTCT